MIVYYFSTTFISRDITSPAVARGVESSLPNIDLDVLSAQRFSEAIGNIETQSENTVEVLASEDVTTTETSIESDGQTATMDESTEIASASDELDQDADLDAEQDQIADVLPTVIEAPVSLIKISRSRKPDQDGLIINEAFTAYQDGDFSTAKIKYLQAFEKTLDNRDVLLGLAAIATVEGETNISMEYYSRLIRLNPLDNIARADLLNYQSDADLLQSISTIKTMLHNNPEESSLFFP